jgi:HAD superfamily hydrolase (TIGR01490 family)
MTQPDPGDATQEAPRRVAVFDLDGTITTRDTLGPFLVGYLARHPARAWRLWRLPFSLLRYLVGLSDRGRLKSSLIRQVIGPAPRRQIDAWTGHFCESHLPRLLNPGALDAIERHRAAGDLLVLLSASVDLYVPRIADRLGFDETVCTGLSWQGDRLEGKLTTENRRGPEKTRCIRRLRGRYPGTRIAAYGNAASDFDHLLQVDEPLVVNASSRTRRRAAELGLATADWRVPGTR